MDEASLSSSCCGEPMKCRRESTAHQQTALRYIEQVSRARHPYSICGMTVNHEHPFRGCQASDMTATITILWADCCRRCCLDQYDAAKV